MAIAGSVKFQAKRIFQAARKAEANGSSDTMDTIPFIWGIAMPTLTYIMNAADCHSRVLFGTPPADIKLAKRPGTAPRILAEKPPINPDAAAVPKSSVYA